MKTCIQTFNIGIDELLTFLTSTEHEAELIGLFKSLDTHGLKEKLLLDSITSAHINRKRYIYSVAIVSLYGLLERLVDTLIEAFVCRVADSVSSYQLMPDAIKKNHIPFSIDLLKAIADERHWTSATQEDVIANLHSCLSSLMPFHVNGAAFVVHRGNITLAKITEILSAVGVHPHLRRVLLTGNLLDFFQLQEPERDFSKVPDNELLALLQPIDELVERRNQISHGVINIDNIESTELLKERCHFIAAYGGALYIVLIQELLKYRITLPGIQSLGKPIIVHNKSIVCFETNNCNVAVGNVIVAATNDTMEPFRYSSIEALQIDHQPFTEIVVSQPTKFAAKVSFKASEQYDYYVLADESL